MMMRYDRGRDSVNVTTGAFSQRDTSGRHVRRGKSRGRERQRLRFVFILTGRSRGVFTRSPWEDTAGLPAPQTPHEDDEEGGAQKEGWRKVTSGTTQKEGGLPSLQGRIKRELEPVTRRPRRSHSQSNCERSRAVWPSTGSSRRTRSSRGCQRSVSGNLVEIHREGFKAMLWTVPG